MKSIDYKIIAFLIVFTTIAMMAGCASVTAPDGTDDSASYNQGFHHGYHIGTSTGRYIVESCQDKEVPQPVSVKDDKGNVLKFFCFMPTNHPKYGEM